MTTKSTRLLFVNITSSGEEFLEMPSNIKPEKFSITPEWIFSRLKDE